LVQHFYDLIARHSTPQRTWTLTEHIDQLEVNTSCQFEPKRTPAYPPPTTLYLPAGSNMQVPRLRGRKAEGCTCAAFLHPVPGAPLAFKPVPRMRRAANPALARRVRLRRRVVPSAEVQEEAEPKTALVAVVLYVGWVIRVLTSAFKTSLFEVIWNGMTWVRELERRLCDPDYHHWAKISEEKMTQPTNYYQ